MMTLKTIAVTPTSTYKLAAAPANSYFRMRAYGLPAGGINSAYRSIASQEQIFFQRRTTRYTEYAPGRVNKVWYKPAGWSSGAWWYLKPGYLPVAAPGTSAHNRGLALDIAPGSVQESWLLSHGSKHGWHRPLPRTDRVHWEYVVSNDTVLRKLKAAQKAVRVGQTGLVDSATRKAVWAVRGANKRPQTFPSGVGYAQTHSGTEADGVWGPNSTKANIATVKAFQTAIGVTPTGHWDSATDRAWINLGK